MCFSFLFKQFLALAVTRRSKTITLLGLTFFINSCVYSQPLPADNELASQYIIKTSNTNPSLGLICSDFLNVLNTMDRKTLQQDVFLNTLKGHRFFAPVDWQAIQDGEQRFGNLLFKKVELYTNVESLPQAVEIFRQYKEDVGGFNYYLGYINLGHVRFSVHGTAPADQNTIVPVVLFVAKKLWKSNNTIYFNYLLLEQDLKSPSKTWYQRKYALSFGYPDRLFMYKGDTFVLAGNINPYLSLPYSALSHCYYSFQKNSRK